MKAEVDLREGTTGGVLASPFRIDHWPRVPVLAGIATFARRKPLGALCAVVVIGMIAVAIAVPWIAPYGYADFNLMDRLQGPSLSHWFGTDQQGRDVFSRVLYGARTSVGIGFSTVALSTAIATIVGSTSGYLRGWTDTLVQRLVDLAMAFPGLIFLIFIASIFGTSAQTLILALGFVFGAGAVRLVRSQALTVSSQTYIEAARSIGCSDTRIILRYVLPNVLFIIIVSASIQIGAIILVESSLAFLGLGVPPPFPEWGQMLQDAQSQMRYHPYLALFPGGAITLAVYAFNMLGDALRDWWDPQLRD